jgi:hypothetical protein
MTVYIYEYMPQFRTGNNLGLLNIKVDAEDASIFIPHAYF